MSNKKTKTAPAPAPTGKIYDFCSKKKMILAIVICVAVALVAGIVIRGVNFAIEFKGGTVLTYDYTGDLDTNAVQSSIGEIVSVPVSVRSGESLDSGGKQITVSFTSEEGLNADRQHELTEKLQSSFPDNAISLFDSMT